ncbi:MAG: 3-oxoacyl-[acyl-carrier-protein] synthase III C-terminal domain-containing protein, partial [Tistlia sp.]
AALSLASTTLPFLDRQNATIVAEASGLRPRIRTQDVGGSLRAGTGALIAAFQDGALEGGDASLVVAADARRARPGSPDELAFGHGAAAILLGRERPIATLLGWTSESDDFVDHYRSEGRDFDYRWEERWARDEGPAGRLPAAVAALLDRLSLTPDGIDRIALPAASAREAQRIAKSCGLDPARVADPLDQACGHLGAAHAPLLLAHCLEQARPGETILLAGLGQGFDLLVLQATEALADYRSAGAVGAALGAGRSDENYLRFLAFEGTLELETGIRAEADLKTAHSVAYRSHGALTGLQAGRCTACGTVQFPPERVCVNRNCGAVDSQEPYPLAGRTARVVSLPADRLADYPDPPVR